MKTLSLLSTMRRTSRVLALFLMCLLGIGQMWGETIYSSDAVASPEGATTSFDKGAFATTALQWASGYANSFTTSGSAGYCQWTFSTPISLAGYTDVKLVAHWGTTSNRPLNVTINGGTATQIDAVTTSADRSKVRTTTEYSISASSISSIKFSSSGGGGVSLFDFTITGTSASYTVTLNLDGGSYSSTPTGWTAGDGVYTKGASGSLNLPEPSKDGFDFAGWKDANDNSVSSPVSVTSTMTLTAQWQTSVQKYAVNFAAGDGTGEMTALEYAEDAEVTLPACTFTAPTGKEFDAWTSSDVTITDGKFTMPANAVTITATWRDKPAEPRTMFSIVMKDGISKSLAKNGGEQALDATYATVTGGSALVKNTDASSDGKMQLTANGIYFNGGNAYLYIALDEELHEGDVITFTSSNSNQICFTLDATRATSLTTVDKSYTIPAESPLIGASEFYVWRTASSSTYIKTLNIKTLEDYVAPVYHSVTFDMQGATSAAIEAQSVMDGKKAVKPVDPEKTGFDFVKWVVAATEADYDWDAAVTADVALKAVWDNPAPSYYIAANGTWCGSEWNPAGTELTYADGVYTYTTTVPANPADNAYEFKITDGTWDYTWGGANVTNTCGIGNNEGNATFKTAVETEVTITFNPSAGSISVVANKPLHEIPYVASSINSWAFDQMSETDGTKWTKTYKLVELPAGNIEFKYSKAADWDHGVWWDGDGNGANATYNVAEAGTYDVTFEYDPCTPLANVVLVKKATQQDVSEATVWDWSKAVTNENLEVALPNSSTEYVLANIDGIVNNEQFKSDALVGKGAYAYRQKSNKCFQGTMIKFHTTVPGVVTYVVVNPTKNTTINLTLNSNTLTSITAPSSGASSKETISKAVAAGDVVLESNANMRVFSITFTPTLTVTTNTLGYATFAPSMKVAIPEEDGLKVYYVVANDGTSVSTEDASGVVEAGTGLIIKTDEPTQVVFAATNESATELSRNLLKGVLEDTAYDETAHANAYLFSKGSNGVGFYKWMSGTLAAGKAYLDLGGAASAPQFIRFVENGSTIATSLEDIFNEEAAAIKFLQDGVLYIRKGDRIYNANGQMVK